MTNPSPHMRDDARAALQTLLHAAGDPQSCGAALETLGRALGETFGEGLSAQSTPYLLLSPEDADTLGRGFLESLEETVPPERISLACFWNERKWLGGTITPIIRRYVEQPKGKVDVLIALTSRLSSHHVLRTNLTEVMCTLESQRIAVVAPVFRKEALEGLRAELSEGGGGRLETLLFAEDATWDEETGIVNPGVGGSVGEGLGVTLKQRNHYRQYSTNML